MKRALIGLLLLAAPPALAQQNVPNIAFDSVPNPVRLPHNMYFGEVSGVALNSKGHVFVLSRGNTTGPAYAAAATQLLEFDAKGNFMGEMGKNPKECTMGCVKAGGKYVFVSGDKVYDIKNQTFAAVAANAGGTVQLTGDVDKDGKTITVSKVTPAGK